MRNKDVFDNKQTLTNDMISTGLRLAEKRSLPCPRRNEWLAARDDIYEQIMKQSWNAEEKFFGQSYEDKDKVDSAVLIMPLVFFISAVSLFA